MNVLILTGRFGMGHVKCAQAIKEEILNKHEDANVNIVDFCDYCFPKLSNSIYKAFEIAVFKFSDTYNRLGELSNRLSVIPFKGKITRKIGKMLKAYSPDLVIADLPMCVQYFSNYKKEKNCTIPFYVYITDITIHKDWISNIPDKYFVGDNVCKTELSKKGINEGKIHVTGIPVSNAFSMAKEKETNTPKVLIMGGGLGLIPCQEKILSALNDTENVETTIVCGKNEKLRSEIVKKYPNINAIGFTNKVSDYLVDSDVILTKPGGITTFEAIKANTPLYIIEPTLEQELGNSKFIEEKGLGRVIKKREDFSVEELLSFILDNKAILSIKENMKALSLSFENQNPVAYLEVA